MSLSSMFVITLLPLPELPGLVVLNIMRLAESN